MRRLQPGFDQLAILEGQFSCYHHDLIDNTVNAQIADWVVSCDYLYPLELGSGANRESTRYDQSTPKPSLDFDGEHHFRL
jgi:hypothetical protein